MGRNTPNGEVLADDKIHNLYCSLSIIRMITSRNMIGRACRTNGEKRNANKTVVGKPEVKRPLERPRRRWVSNIKMELREVWIGLIWLRIGTSGGLL
jgi:hypothetical protein